MLEKPSRRAFVQGGLAATLALNPTARLFGQTGKTLHVASAGSIAPFLNGPVRERIANSLQAGIDVHSQGADAVAKALIAGALQADVFLPITAAPMNAVLKAGLADVAVPIARTEMVLQYSPKSRFRAQFEDAAAGKAAWWQVLQQPGLRLMRSDPTADPGGRNAIFVVMLAARKYGQPGLVEKLLGPALNPEQILKGSNLQERFASGEIDAGFSYRIGPVFSHLPFIELPVDVNLSALDLALQAEDLSFAVDGISYRPEPLVFYAAQLKNAATPILAAEFMAWLTGAKGQELLRDSHFAAATSLPALLA
jgi:molybdate/tungstate transport system substrate-binding protein